MADDDAQMDAPGSGETGTATQAPPKRKKEKKPAKRPGNASPRQLPPYKVILHNDDVNTMDHVILTIRRLCGLPKVRAVTCTLEAHYRGCALVLVTHRERAELYVEQFASCGLTATAEPDR